MDILPVQQHAAGGRLQEGVEMLDEGGLAGAGMPQQPNELSRGDREAHALDGDLFKRSVRAVRVAQLLNGEYRHRLTDPSGPSRIALR